MPFDGHNLKLWKLWRGKICQLKSPSFNCACELVYPPLKNASYNVRMHHSDVTPADQEISWRGFPYCACACTFQQRALFNRSLTTCLPDSAMKNPCVVTAHLSFSGLKCDHLHLDRLGHLNLGLIYYTLPRNTFTPPADNGWTSYNAEKDRNDSLQMFKTACSRDCADPQFSVAFLWYILHLNPQHRNLFFICFPLLQPDSPLFSS